ncbi:enoyl-CoA hydratase-related protein [Arthrobacter sp. I2-34]|uniref:Enoyl-CoA hydratase-related protein n=1 Tax=Arthrobacter hankyongi TaxID=2904801 RepID=A0ABS9L594_9MICC|nr:enoyl-CoA hydratase-related protein [Arthrobacter hankyongi]
MVVTLDRPKANAIDAATSRALYDAFSMLRDDVSLRAAVLTGAGKRFFSAGWDLKSAEADEASGADHGPGGFAGLTELFGLGKPVIAAVNGAAYGGGVELMLAAHLAVAAETAVFAVPEARLGVLPDAGGLLRLPARLPRPVALELLLTGRTFSALEAQQ